jgi:nitroreductase
VRVDRVALMQLDEVIRRRRMCRHFLDRPVPPELVDQLLDRAMRAPSAGHTQGWAFLVLEGREQTSRFWSTDADAAWLARPDHPGVLHAPVLILPFCNSQAYLDRYAAPDKTATGLAGVEANAWPAPYWLIDTAFATMLLLLGAVEEGLGALFFRTHGDPARLRAEFGVPPGWEPIGVVAVGWPAPSGPANRRRSRRPPEEVVHRGCW